MQKISNYQAILMGGTLVLSGTLISVTSQAVVYGKQHTYLSLILASLVIIPALWALSKVSQRYPNQDLFECIIKRFSILGRIIVFLYSIFYFFILVRDIRMTVDFVNIILLPATPIYVIGFLLVVCIMYMTRGGIEVSARMTEIYFPLLAIAVLLLPTILVKEFDTTMLMPYLLFDITGILKGAWFYVAYVGEVIGVVFLVQNKEFRFKYGLIGLGVGTFVMFVLVISSQLILGTKLTPRLFYPSYELVRHLRVTDFLDRFDLPLVGIWLPTMIIKISYSLYIVCNGFKRLFPDVSGKLLTTPFAAFGFVCSFWIFRDSIQLFNFNRNWPALSLLFQLFLPFLLLLVVREKKKKKLET